MSKTRNLETGSGISRALARRRLAAIGDLHYRLRLSLPSDPRIAVQGEISIRFRLTAAAWPEIDFAPVGDDRACREMIESVSVSGCETEFEVAQGHIRILGETPVPGEQRVDIRFTAGDTGLIRRPGLVYTLFVPARAHRVLPCFDQPDLKATLALELEVPSDWTVLANAPETDRTSAADRLRVCFAATARLPTYLFAFVAGELELGTRNHGERSFVVACPGTSLPAVTPELGEILQLHGAALDLLERYTGIPYPYAQLGFVLIPDFEFAGMEHPGAIFYRQNLLLLGGEAGVAERIRRASLIAHETAHMWFGNLVTIRWFDDVWLKEVFASFMADKLVARTFPAIDHRLDFALRHIPPAFAIDRSEGTHAIRQALENLDDAGELYDALIYHKAPIAIAALEREIGTRAMRQSLKRYLGRYRAGNADWSELRDCLQRETRHDIDAFSRRWIETAGLPRLRRERELDSALPYGWFPLDQAGRLRRLEILSKSTQPLRRATTWLALFEDMLAGGVEPARLLTAALPLLERETDDQLIGRLLDDLHEIYWRLLPPGRRAVAAGPVERCLRQRAAGRSSASPAPTRSRTSWLLALARFALSEATLSELEAIWRGREPGCDALPESPSAALALTLALHRRDRSTEILGEQIERTRQPDRRERLQFLMPAVADDPDRRDALFDRLTAGEGRGAWAVAGAGLLNHALYADQALAYLERGLRYAGRLRARGEIFLPRQWLTALFSGHGSGEAARIVRAFLETGEPPPRLAQLIRQTADPVFRAARIRG